MAAVGAESGDGGDASGRRSGSDPGRLRTVIAEACRVLAATGLVEHILGHVSARGEGGEVWIRGRRPTERGLLWTELDDIRPVGLDGASRDERAAADGWFPPNELPLHLQVLTARPDVTAVVHAHPPAVVAASVADLPWLPVVGAYDIPAARLAADGIPVWPRSALVRTTELGAQAAAALGSRPVLVLRGHGLVTVGEGDAEMAVKLAVTRAFAVESLARVMLQVGATGQRLRPIAEDDLAELPDLGAGFNVDALWQHLLTRIPD
ncbi:MAG: class II aldolase/adducin family protein [Actinomycetes bacterium]